MRQLRVMKLYHATLVRYNDKTHRLLKACEPYVTWGEPDVRTVRDLITKRGYAVVDVSKINEMYKSEQNKRSTSFFEKIAMTSFYFEGNFFPRLPQNRISQTIAQLTRPVE